MRRMGSILVGLMAVAAMKASLQPTSAAVPGGIAPPSKRAEDLIAQARAALGGNDLLKSVTGLVVKFDVRTVIEGSDHRGGREYRLLLPDKYEEDEEYVPAPAITVLTRSIIDGGSAWMKVEASSKVGKVHAQGGNTGMKPAKEKELRDNFALLTVAWLLKSPPSVALQFGYVGHAVASDGEADAIDVTAPDGFSARLFLDARKHVPLMVSYRSAMPRLLILSAANNDEKTVQELRRRAQTEMPPKVEAEIEVRLKDYRPVNGILFPHTITKTARGRVFEEMVARDIRINPQDLSAASFARQ